MNDKLEYDCENYNIERQLQNFKHWKTGLGSWLHENLKDYITLTCCVTYSNKGDYL